MSRSGGSLCTPPMNMFKAMLFELLEVFKELSDDTLLAVFS